MAQWVKTLASYLTILLQSPEPTQGRKKTDSSKLFSDLHTCTLADMHPSTHTYKQVNVIKTN